MAKSFDECQASLSLHAFQQVSFVGQIHRSDDHREHFVTHGLFREARGSNLSYANSNFNEKIHSSNSFDFAFRLQIIGRKQIDGSIQMFGLDSKGLSPRSNLTQIWPRLFSRGPIFCVCVCVF